MRKKLKPPTKEQVEARLRELAQRPRDRNRQPIVKQDSGRWYDQADVKDFDSIIRSVR